MKPVSLVKRRLLDPRPAADAKLAPILKSVNIPLEEIAQRVSELPPKAEVILVADIDGFAPRTVACLASLGRAAVVSEEWEMGSSSAKGRLWEPNDFLSAYCVEVPNGRALDLGCGSGRDAVYLASEGWNVTAIDVLPDAIERGKDLASRYLEVAAEEKMEWRIEDLTKPTFCLAGHYDLVHNAFFFDRELLARSLGWLQPGGSLVVEAFTSVHQEMHGKPASPARVVKSGEMAQVLSGLDIQFIEEGEHTGRHTVRAWARKDG